MSKVEIKTGDRFGSWAIIRAAVEILEVIAYIRASVFV
jgi:hypothetical protein